MDGTALRPLHLGISVESIEASVRWYGEMLGFTLLSNMGAGILDQPLSEQEVLDAAEAAREKFSGLVRACLRKL